jgi:hypothetical protein
MPGFDIQDTQIRYRVADPSLFKDNSFITKQIEGIKGLSFILGKKKDSDSLSLQAYRFDKANWNLDRAKKWVKKHQDQAKEIIEITEVNEVESIKKILENDPVKETIIWNDLIIRLEYLENDIRFANTDHPTKLTNIYGYGYFEGTTSEDKEELDCYLSKDYSSNNNIFRLTQLDFDGNFDEYKFMLGFPSIEDAKQAYISNMPKEWLGDIIVANRQDITLYAQWLIEFINNLFPNNYTTDLQQSIKESLQSNSFSTIANSTQSIRNLIELSLRNILRHCNGGINNDGQGYRKNDAVLVSKLLTIPVNQWDDNQEKQAIAILYRYRKQLKDFNIDYQLLIPAIDDGVQESDDSTVALETIVTETATFRHRVVEVASNGLPLIVEFEGPAEGTSQNYYINANGEKIHREWSFAAFSKGTKTTNELFISKGIFPRVQLSHPDDDPEETGIVPAGELIGLETIPTTKRLRGLVKLYHSSNEGLEVARRYANKDYPDYSIRVRPTCSDNELYGQCMPNDNAPLLVDFLRAYERPGLPGSKGTKIIESQTNEQLIDNANSENSVRSTDKEVAAFASKSASESDNSTHPCECDEKTDEKDRCKECNDKFIRIKPQSIESKRVNKKSSNKIRVFENFINNFSLAGRGNINSGNKLKGVDSMSKQLAKILDKIANTENADVRKAVAETASVFLSSKEKKEMDGDMMDGEDPELDAEEMDGEDPNMDKEKKAKMAEKKEKYAKEMNSIVKQITKEVTNSVLTAIKPVLPANATTEKVANESAKTDTQPAAKPPIATTTVDSKAVLESLGIDEETWKAERARLATERAKTVLESQLRTAHKTAFESKQLFCNHNISDVALYPETAVESAIRAACQESDLTAATGFLKAELAHIAKEAKAVKESVNSNSTSTTNGYLDRFAYGNGSPAFNSVSVGENNELRKGVEEIKKELVGYIQDNDPEGFKRYEYNKNLPNFKRKAEEALQNCVKHYGAGAIMAYNKKRRDRASEDVNPVGFSDMPNYPAVMTALMQVRQWRRSPVWDLVGNSPAVSMNLGQMLNGSTGPMGQFVEIYTESRSQRRDYDAQYIQSASDIQREISVDSTPYQYFAYQETTRVRWTTELEAFLRMAPLNRDVPARLLFNLMEELDAFTEQRISTEMLRASDAYSCTTITNETTNIAATNTWNYTGGTAGITLPDGTYISNGIGWVWMRRGFASGTTTPVYGPVVRPGVDPTLNRATLTFPVTYPVNINAINGVTQVRGMYDSVSQSGVKINSTGADPTFIVFADIGVTVFLQGSGFDATHMPTFAQYSSVDNVLRFDFTPGSGEGVAAIGNRYVEAVASIKGTFSQRQTDPKAKTFLLTADPVLQNVVAFATHFQGLNQLQYAQIASGYKPESNYVVAELRNTKFLSTSEPLYSTNYRAIFGTEGLTIYDELMPPMLSDLTPGIAIDQNGRGGYTSEQSRSIARRAIIATIPPRDPVTGDPKNFGYAGLYHIAFPQVSGLPLS